MSNGMQYGGFWRRAIAAIVDAFVIGFIALPFFLVAFAGVIFYVISTGGGVWTDSTTIGTNEVIAGFVINFVILLVYIGYFAGMESSLRQATYGKMMLGVKVTDEDGFRISFWRAVGRYFAKYLSIFTLFIGFLMAAFTEKKQALHDMVAKTLVIKEGGSSFWPAIKAVLISILLFVLLFAGCLYYGYVKYGSMLDEKSFQEFFTELMSTATLTGHIDTSDPLSKTTDADGASNSVPTDTLTTDLQDHKDPALTEEGNKQKESACPDESFTSTPLEQREDGLIYKINEDSPYTGVNCSYYESGAKQEVSNAVEGRAHGAYTTWYENGNKKEHFNLEHGLPHGAYTTWYENGNKEKEVNLVKNLFEGPYVLYFENGQLREVGTYEKSNLHGQTIFWDEEGNFTKSQIYENGELLETSTTPPENLSEVANSLTTGLQDHEAPTSTEEIFDLENNNDVSSLNAQLKESFHENGVKKMEAHYVDGKLNGSSTLWNEYGKKIIIINYKEDKRHGLLTRWHNNGQKKIEINYIDDKRDGEMTFWNENGNVKKTLTYSNGELLENNANESSTVPKGQPQADIEKTPSAGLSALQNEIVNSTFYKGPITTTGPVILEIDAFFSDNFWIKPYMLFNIENELTTIDIKIDKVLDKQNVNFYNPESAFETGDFHRVKKLDTTSVNNIKAVSATRSVMINPGLTKKTFSSVSGTVTIIAPKNIKTITFAPEEINQEKNAVGNMVKIVKSEQVNEKTYNVKFEFNNNNTFLKTEAYDANGEKISSPSSSYNKGWRSMNFTSTPSKINIFVSESIEESTYPFLLKK